MPKPTKKQDVRPYWLINYRHNNTNYWDTIGEDQDGRHFHCDYGNHSELAREIVGKIEDIKDAQKYLEQQNWVVIYKERYKNG